MSKNARNAVIAVGVLAVLLGAYLGLMKKDTKEEESQQTDNVVIDKKGVDVVSLSMTQTSSGNHYILKKNQSGNWYAQGHEQKEINPPSVEEIIKAATDLKAVKIVSETGAKAHEFGLDKGYALAEITYQDGDVIGILVGDKTADGSGYYAMKENGSAIYMINVKSGAALSYEFSDVRERYTHLVNPEKLEYVSIQKKGEEELIIEPNPIKSLTTSYGYGVYIMTKGYQEPKTVLSDALKKKIVKPATSIIIKQFVEDDVIDYEKYGLVDYAVHLFIRDELKNEIDLYIGNEDGKGNYYIRYGDENSVYTVSKDIIEPMTEVTKYYLIDKYVDLVNIDDISQIEIEAEGIFTVITMERYMDTVGQEEKEVEKTIYKVDGMTVETRDYKDFFGAFVAINVDGEIGEKPVGQTVLSTKVTMNDGRVTQVKYLEYDENFYAVNRNGTTELIANQKDIHTLIEATNILLTKTMEKPA